MVAISALWLPIVLSAVLVFVASSVVHMVLTYHRSDYAKLPNEEKLRGAIRAESVPAGEYLFPHMTMQEMRSPEGAEKFKKGPVGMLTLRPSGPMTMGKPFVQWFVFSVVVGVFAAYVAGRKLSAGTPYLPVFRVVGTVAFLTYAGGAPIASIWRGQSWSTTLKHSFDGLLYGLLTAGTFGWLWPKM